MCVPPQLVLHCASAVACGIYTRLLKRCLLAVVAAADGSSSTQAPALVAGAGAAEMGWGLLWADIAAHLDGTATGGPAAPRSRQAVASVLADAVRDTTRARHQHAPSPAAAAAAALARCRDICLLLSATYLAVPRLLVDNALHVPRGGEGGNGARETRRAREAFADWHGRCKRDPMAPCWGLVTPVCMGDSGGGDEGEGEGGLWADIHAPLCTLADATAASGTRQLPVLETAHTQWEIFAAVVGGCRLCLRVGGPEGIVRVTSLAAARAGLRGQLVLSRVRQRDDSDDEEEEEIAEGGGGE